MASCCAALPYGQHVHVRTCDVSWVRLGPCTDASPRSETDSQPSPAERALILIELVPAVHEPPWTTRRGACSNAQDGHAQCVTGECMTRKAGRVYAHIMPGNSVGSTSGIKPSGKAHTHVGDSHCPLWRSSMHCATLLQCRSSTWLTPRTCCHTA